MSVILGTWHYAPPKKENSGKAEAPTFVKYEECPKCHTLLRAGDWPFCPHGKDAA